MYSKTRKEKVKKNWPKVEFGVFICFGRNHRSICCQSVMTSGWSKKTKKNKHRPWSHDLLTTMFIQQSVNDIVLRPTDCSILSHN